MPGFGPPAGGGADWSDLHKGIREGMPGAPETGTGRFRAPTDAWDAGSVPSSLDDFFYASTGYASLMHGHEPPRLPEKMPNRFTVLFDRRKLRA
jgi:hypothetical protein